MLPSPYWKEEGWENANFSSKMKMSTKINKTIKAINKSLNSTKFSFRYFIIIIIIIIVQFIKK